jgi:hypothetical protein
MNTSSEQFLRSSPNNTIWGVAWPNADIDAASATMQCEGFRSTITQRNPSGIYHDVIDNASVLGSKLQGAPFRVVNVSGNALTVATQSCQLLNSVAVLTSTTEVAVNARGLSAVEDCERHIVLARRSAHIADYVRNK